MGSWIFPRSHATTLFWVALWLGMFASGVLHVASEDESSKETDPKEVQALLGFKAALDDPNGNLKSWTATSDPCSGNWDWVVCEEDETPQELDQNFKHVTALRLLNLNLGGEINGSIGDLPALTYLDLMWNRLTGSIPATIGNLGHLEFLLLSGNQLSGPLPLEMGNLADLQRLQIDENELSGTIPSTFTNLTSIVHLHMNNNTLSGNVPSGLGVFPNLLHVLLDNNRLTGTLPDDLANAPKLRIIQLDNNRFSGIPAAYTRIPTLLKLSMRNCSLAQSLPNFNQSSNLAVLDVSHNSLTGSLQNLALPPNITSLDLSNNELQGPVPASIGNLQNLGFLELSNNNLSGDIAANLGLGRSFNETAPPRGVPRIILDFQNNSLILASGSALTTIYTGSSHRVQIWLSGNTGICTNTPASVINPFCIPTTVDSYLTLDVPQYLDAPACESACEHPEQRRQPPLNSPDDCSCAIPIIVWYRLKSPPFAIFDLYETQFRKTIANELEVSDDQIKVNSTEYEVGPRIRLGLFIFPAKPQKDFNATESARILGAFYDWQLAENPEFGPYEILSVSPPESHRSGSKSISVGAIVGIVCGAVLVSAISSALLVFCCLRRRGSGRVFGRSRRPTPINVPGVKSFSFAAMAKATSNFRDENLLGRGGYGKVYFGVLEDGQKVAVKRAEEGSLQGAKEFETEIHLLSRVHHRNLVALVGYCNDDGEHVNGEQMLVYEFVPNGNLRQHLAPGANPALDISTRIRIAIGAARGIQYLHTQADPPIFHRDIKAPNILLDAKYNAKVSDFGLSRMATADADIEGVHTGHVTTVVKGTPGYLDPEYFLTHKLTDRSDVYSFGVVLLELITGLPPIVNGRNLTREVKAANLEGDVLRIVDPRMGAYSMATLRPLLDLGLSCIDTETNNRPSMTDALHQLEEIWKQAPWSEVASQSRGGDDSVELQEIGPGHGLPRNASSSNPSGNFDSGESDLISHPNISIFPR